MIADIYKCPQCGTDVYLSPDEEYCPLCGEKYIDEMELIERGVDLEKDSLLDEPTYANFDHLAEVLKLLYGDNTDLYLLDCWQYAWDATKTDLANADTLGAFLNNPNEVISGKKAEPMTRKGLWKEIVWIIRDVLSKSKFPRTWEDAYYNSYSFVKEVPFVRLYIKKDLTYITAEVCPKQSLATEVFNYTPIDRKKPVPRNKRDYHIFECRLFTDVRMKYEFSATPYNLADDVVAMLFNKYGINWRGFFRKKPDTYMVRKL